MKDQLKKSDRSEQSARSPTAALGPLQAKLEESLREVERSGLIERFWKKDPSLWKSDPGHEKIIKNAMGWIGLPESMGTKAGDLQKFATEIKKEGFKRVLLLGMGGSSLAPEVFRHTFGHRTGYPELLVLDSTEPEAVARADRESDPRETLFVVSSKSGTTTEPLRFLDYFFGRARSVLGDRAGRNFVAITDPGSLLEKMAGLRGFRKVFSTPPDVGGRYSALTYFGLVPAALIGVDVSELLGHALALFRASVPGIPAQDNPGVWLGSVLGTLACDGRDKITFLVSPEISSLGLWLEQLIAESTGKEGKGVVPIADEPLLDPGRYGSDRVFVHIRLDSSRNHSLDHFVQKVEKAGHPVIRISVADRIRLCAEFYRWEIATAVLSHFLAIDPFDQPNVQQAKDKTKSLLEQFEKQGSFPTMDRQVTGPNISLTFSRAARKSLGSGLSQMSVETALGQFLSEARSGDYLGLLPYVSCWEKVEERLGDLRVALLRKSQCPVQFGYGPRYLHSTGQLHKGGPNSGIFLIISRSAAPDVKIPDAHYTFGQLIAAQALGDFQALDDTGRRAVFVEIKGDPDEAVARLADAVGTGRQAAV